jgi:hypothetical protein
LRFRDRFLELLDHSVVIFKELTGLMETSYESLSDVPAVNPVKLETCPYHWRDLLPIYQRESEIYRKLMSEIGGPDFRSPAYEGLAGIWFGDPGFKNPRISLGTDRIEYVWNRDDQKPEGGRNWSAQWFGSLVGPADTEIWFVADADQTVRVRIGDAEVIDREFKDLPRTDDDPVITGKIMMEKGKYYPIIIEYDHAGRTAGHISLKWKIGDGDPERIPGNYFKHSRADQFRVERMLIRPERINRKKEP